MALAINKDNFESLLASEQLVVIDFWAEWCGPCRMIGPIVEELAAEFAGKAVIGKCDVEENDEITMKYGVRFRQRRPGRRQTGWSLREGGPEGQDRKVRVGADNDPQEATAEQILPSSCLFISYLEKKIGN